MVISGVVTPNSSVAVDPPRQLDPVDDIAPLVGPAHLQPAAGAPRQLQEIIGLEDHVVEFEEGQRLLAVEPQLDAVEGQHPVDREVPPDLAQERDILERVEPFGIVGHDRVGRAVAELRNRSNTRRMPAMLASIVGVAQQLAAFVLARRIADLGRSAAHQHDRAVPGLLQPAKHHDLDQAADVEARRGRVEADVGGDDFFAGERIERRGVGRLVDVAALVEERIRLEP